MVLMRDQWHPFLPPPPPAKEGRGEGSSNVWTKRSIKCIGKVRRDDVASGQQRLAGVITGWSTPSSRRLADAALSW
ncbi:hypothetical protein TNCT_553971 [Trichonephila clavata]|uniref:Uncharacterized protein n=1 Tax=Trichonephila clavata TaxID=2740835 RepID=A0A8X6LMW5_TRICU|nr:hypothetical protein TNCT_553971 [Trichonephila clavata]